MARVPGGLSFSPVPSDMSRACLTAGILAILAAPASAQIGLTSAPRSVSLLATRQSSVTVTMPDDGIVTTAWNIDPAEPLAMTLRAFVGQPVLARGRAPTWGAKAIARLTGYLTTDAPAVTVLFTQPIGGGGEQGERQDEVSGPGSARGSLTLAVTTQ
jgi:hypothetical protein